MSDPNQQEETPPPDISHLSERSQRLLMELKALQASPDETSVKSAYESIKIDLDGQPLALLEETLDWLRDEGLYDLSISLLEDAWSADLPEDFLGRVAQDWVGSVLFGLGDRAGATVVARHLSKRAQELGPTFCGDLCDLWLEWGLYETGEALARFVHEAQPGEVSALFHLMICAKVKLAWDEARSWLSKLDATRTSSAIDPAIEWNRGLLAVEAHDWTEARAAWERVGFNFPDQPAPEGGEKSSEPSLSLEPGDYARHGELSPVRLKLSEEQRALVGAGTPHSEVVWGRRIGPARVELTGIPFYHPEYRCGDILLIDGVQDGRVELNGQQHTVVPALARWAPAPGETIKLYGEHTRLKQTMILEGFTQRLGERGWAIANWTRFARRETPSGNLLLQLTLYLPPDRDLSEFTSTLTQLQEAGKLPPLFSPRYAELTGGVAEEHERALQELGVFAEFIEA